MTDHPQALPPFVVHRILALMERRKLTRRHLAKRAGVSDGTVRRVLEGCDVKLSTLTAIASACGVEVVTLLQADAA